MNEMETDYRNFMCLRCFALKEGFCTAREVDIQECIKADKEGEIK